MADDRIEWASVDGVGRDSLNQLRRCMENEYAVRGALMADRRTRDPYKD